jgi:uncharacterized membrane protein YbhN (UPF0104 family)
MRGNLRRWWPVLKALFCLAILVLIGRQFAADLRRPELARRSVHLGWLALSGLLYLLGLAFSALYWHRLLAHLGSPLPLGTALRAYYIGHLGKYVPGKAWALLLRAAYARGGGLGLGLGALTSFYEVITTMAAGALAAAVLFALLGRDAGAGLSGADLRGLLLQMPEGGVASREAAVLASLALFAATGLPLLPGLFNRVVHHLTLPFRRLDDPVPPIRLAYLVEGLLFTAVGWQFLAASLAAALCAVVGADLNWSGPALGRLSASLSLAYVAGFVVLVAPGGLGVREFFLTLLLAPEVIDLTGAQEPADARADVVLAVLALRLTWTVAELLLASVLYVSGPRSGVSSQESGVSGQESAVSA